MTYRMPHTAFWALSLWSAVLVGQDMMPPASSSQPGSQPAGATLSIRAVQGTPGAPDAGADDVTIELFRPDKKVDRSQARLDEHGVLMLEGLSLSTKFQPRVTVQHAGVKYVAVGKAMDASNRSQQLTVTIYETTSKRPEWEIRMQHVMLHPSANGLRVIETMAVHNPGKRTYVSSGKGAEAKPTVVIELPPGAENVNVGGAFDDCCTKVRGTRLVHLGPLLAGSSQFRIGYILPVDKDGHAHGLVTTPAPVRQLLVFAPGQKPHLTSGDLAPGQVFNVKGGPMRVFKAGNLPAGKRVFYALGALARPQKNLIEKESPRSAQMVAAVGGGVLLILGLLVLLMPRSAREADGAAGSQS